MENLTYEQLLRLQKSLIKDIMHLLFEDFDRYPRDVDHPFWARFNLLRKYPAFTVTAEEFHDILLQTVPEVCPIDGLRRLT